MNQISPICNLRFRLPGIKFRLEIFMRAKPFLAEGRRDFYFRAGLPRAGQPGGHDRCFRRGHGLAKRLATDRHHLAKRLSQLAELQHRGGRDDHLQPAVHLLRGLEPHQRPESVADFRQPSGQRRRRADEFVGVLFRAEFIREGRRPGRFHRANLPQNNGGAWEFNGPPPAASIINYGKINIANGGSAFLIAENVANYGDIAAPGGTIGIAAGQDVLVSERPDGRGLSMKVTLPEGAVDNEGHLVADAGTISVNAQVVNQNGIVQANSVRDENGVIELVASDQLNLGANSQISRERR